MKIDNKLIQIVGEKVLYKDIERESKALENKDLAISDSNIDGDTVEITHDAYYMNEEVLDRVAGNIAKHILK
jgi:hypothetical protein